MPDDGPSEHLATSAESVQERLSAEPRLVQLDYAYLDTLPYVTWAGFMISSPDRQLAAAKWLAFQYTDFDTYLTASIKAQQENK